MIRSLFTGLWHHADFRRLWAGLTISVFGSQITLLAIPLTAALTLDATPAEMGLLTAMGTAPDLLMSLFAGAWVDRRRRRPILIWGDIGRALLLATIPIAAALDLLSVWLLAIVAFLVGTLSVFFRVAYASLLPSLVDRAQLIEGNSKLEMSRSVAATGGPGLAGGLVQLVTAPYAILVDAISFLASAFFIRQIRTPEQPPAIPERRQGIWREIGEGLRFSLGNPLLRASQASAATINFFGNVIGAIYVLYVTRELDLSPGVIGLIVSTGGPASILGALSAGRITGRLGLGPTLTMTIGVIALGVLLIPLAAGPTVVVVLLLMGHEVTFGFAASIYAVHMASLSQAITPDRLLGRMRASTNFLVAGVLPLGALAGGALGELVGLRTTIVIGAIGTLLGVLWIVFSPVRTLREPPAPAEEPAVAATPAGDV